MRLLRRLLPRLLPSRGRPRLVLHIGTHKTGTTSIQAALRGNRAALRRVGICYPDPARDPHPDLPAHNFIYRATLNGPQAMADERTRIRDEFEASRADCLILSEEGLSLPRDALQEFFAPWRDVFDFRIVCFLRRQDRYAESLYSQYVREKKAIALGEIAAFLTVPEIAARFDYDTNLRRWDAFGPVQAVNYDLLKGDALHRPVLAAAGADLRIADTPLSNVSPPAGAIELIRHMNRAGLDYALGPLLTHVRRDPPAGLHDLLARRSMMGAALRAEFMAGLKGVNARLEVQRSITFGTDLPDEPAKTFHVDLKPEMITQLAADSMRS